MNTQIYDYYEFKNRVSENDLSFESINNLARNITKLCDLDLNIYSSEGIKDFVLKIWNFFKEFIIKIAKWIRRIIGDILGSGPVRKAVKLAKYPFNLRLRNCPFIDTLKKHLVVNEAELRQHLFRIIGFYKFSFEKNDVDICIKQLGRSVKDFSYEFRRVIDNNNLEKLDCDKKALDDLFKYLEQSDKYANDGEDLLIPKEIKFTKGQLNAADRIIKDIYTVYKSMIHIGTVSDYEKKYEEMVGVKGKINTELFVQNKVNRRYEQLSDLAVAMGEFSKVIESVDPSKITGDTESIKNNIKELTKTFRSFSFALQVLSRNIMLSSETILTNARENQDMMKFADDIFKTGGKNIFSLKNPTKEDYEKAFSNIDKADNPFKILKAAYSGGNITGKEIGTTSLLSTLLFSSRKHIIEGYPKHPFYTAPDNIMREISESPAFTFCIHGISKIGRVRAQLVFLNSSMSKYYDENSKTDKGNKIKVVLGHEYGHGLAHDAIIENNISNSSFSDLAEKIKKEHLLPSGFFDPMSDTGHQLNVRGNIDSLRKFGVKDVQINNMYINTGIKRLLPHLNGEYKERFRYFLKTYFIDTVSKEHLLILLSYYFRDYYKNNKSFLLKKIDLATYCYIYEEIFADAYGNQLFKLNEKARDYLDFSYYEEGARIKQENIRGFDIREDVSQYNNK